MGLQNRTPIRPDLRITYPHFAPGDAAVWETWLAVNRPLISEVYYDVTIGGVIITDPDIDEALRDAWQYDTALKVDAVAVTDLENLVCEVKPVARLGALGQALGYSLLLNEDPLNDKPNQPTVITTSASAEVQRAAELLGVRIDVVTPPT